MSSGMWKEVESGKLKDLGEKEIRRREVELKREVERKDKHVYANFYSISPKCLPFTTDFQMRSYCSLRHGVVWIHNDVVLFPVFRSTSCDRPYG